MEKVQSARILCKGGLNTNQNFLDLSETSPGSATALINYEMSLNGGYRRINGFRPYNTDYAEVTSDAFPAEGPILGVFGFFNHDNGNYEVIAARKQVSGDTYEFYLSTPSGWERIDTGLTRSSVDVSRLNTEVGCWCGVKNRLVIVDGVNPAIVYDGTNWKELVSTNTGGDLSPGGDQILDKPSIVTSFKGHIFLSGDEDYPGVVSFSAPLDPYDWTAASGSGQQVPGFTVVQIKPFRDELFVFGREAIKKSIPDAAAGFVFQDVTKNLGCIARDSVVELDSNLIFLSPDGIRPVAGTSKIGDVEFSLLSQNIQFTIANMQRTFNLENLRSVVIRNKSQFRYFISNAATSRENSYGLIGAINSRSGESTWEFGELVGIRTSCCWSGYIGNQEIVLHGDFDGSVYRQEQGNTFDGEDIIAVFSTPYLDFGDTAVRKTIRRLNTFLFSEGNVELNIAVNYDWDKEGIINPIDYLEQTEGLVALYDSGFLYDDGHVYAGAAQPVFRTNIQGSGFSTQISFVSVGASAPYTVQGFVIEFTPDGRE